MNRPGDRQALGGEYTPLRNNHWLLAFRRAARIFTRRVSRRKAFALSPSWSCARSRMRNGAHTTPQAASGWFSGMTTKNVVPRPTSLCTRICP
jgi:hypothetical protein